MTSGTKSCACAMINNLTLYNLTGGTCKYESIFLHVLYYNIFVTFAASDSVTNFVNAVSDLELSMQQLNSTNDMLNLEIDGKRYTSTGKAFQSVVNCPDGQGRNTYFCGECFINRSLKW